MGINYGGLANNLDFLNKIKSTYGKKKKESSYRSKNTNSQSPENKQDNANQQNNVQEQSQTTTNNSNSLSTSTDKPNSGMKFTDGKKDTYTANYGGIDTGEASRLANETLLAKIMYGKPIERLRMTDETVEGMNYSRGLREKAMNQDLLGAKLNQMGNIKDAQRYTGQAAASAAIGQASMAGGDVASDKIVAGKVGNAVSPIYAQLAQQLASVEQQYQQNQFARNQLEGANNTDMVSHSNTREYINEDHPLKALIDKLAMEQGAMNFLANKKALESGNFSVNVNGKDKSNG